MLQHRAVLERNAKFRQRLNEVLPLDDGGQMRDISLLNGAPISHVESRVFVGDEDLDGAIMQVEKLKGYINKLELQIYEMNEKVSELIENVRMRGHLPAAGGRPATHSLFLVIIKDAAVGEGEQELEGGKRKHEQCGQDGDG